MQPGEKVINMRISEIWDPRNPCNYNQRGREWERPCNIQVFRNGRKEFQQNVGMRISGNYSRCNPQKSITFYARRDYSKPKMKYDFFGGNCRNMNGEIIEKYDKVTLRNGGNDAGGVRYRDDLVAYLMSGLNVSTMCKADYILFINGEFWGYYSLQEKLGDEYVESHYGIEASNVTCIKNGQCDGNAQVCDEYLMFYDWAMQSDLSDPENYSVFSDTIDTDSFIDYMIMESYISNWDFGANINNWMMWRATVPVNDGYGDGRWRFMVYDTEFSCGLYGSESTSYMLDFFSDMDTDPSRYAPPALLKKVMENDVFRSAFYNRYVELMSNLLLPENVLPLIDAYEEKLYDAFNDTMSRFSQWGDIRSDSENVRTFFRKRPAYALMYLNRFCGNEETGKQIQITVFENNDWNLWCHEAKATVMKLTGDRSVIKTEETGIEVWFVQYIAEITLKKDRTYRFRFKANTQQTFGVCIQENRDEYETFCFRQFYGTGEEQEIEITFRMDRDCEYAKIAILCGYQTGSYQFSDMKLYEEY
ncbi:MAG: hypothetical protein CW338_06065 [Clostridiales bacterium]|nr:hypothetical protein [Clostridiales bacterium]